ncbi:histidine phosphatase family protein [Burkholderia sp. Ax-1719]|uniref:histidine phosphatase family protein n=1 Tax=Burkholderia sp. Ax-1719 TaxID=2608334 RepID=UPI00141DD0A9|nr:histidine phosphatase family protein [Burkholderia sp. Ax-1719]NIE65071.1 histidine phosphatase family protein [Burkholderia sp. Ax-1719]
MATKVWLISHAANADLRAGVLATEAGSDEGVETALDARAIAAVEAWRTRWQALIAGSGDAARVLTSPAPVARASARAAGFDAQIEHALADTAFGAWAGCRLNDIAQHAPEALAAWTRDPSFQPPGGGESFDDVRKRVGAWLDALPEAENKDNAPVIAFTHASVIRAAVLHALGAPSATFRQLEIAPLSVTTLRRSAQGWVWVAATA